MSTDRIAVLVHGAFADAVWLRRRDPDTPSARNCRSGADEPAAWPCVGCRRDPPDPRRQSTARSCLLAIPTAARSSPKLRPPSRTSKLSYSCRRSRSMRARAARRCSNGSRPRCWHRPTSRALTTCPGAAGGPDLFIKIADFHETFCADLPDDVAAPMAVSQRPLSAAALTENATLAGWKSLPTWYMVSERDNAIPPDCERFMAQRMGASTESVEGSHAAFIAHPDIAAASDPQGGHLGVNRSALDAPRGTARTSLPKHIANSKNSRGSSAWSVT